MNNKINIKFCGLKNYDEVAFAYEKKIFWIGFIFVKGSSRFIKFNETKEIISQFKNKLNFVGVFVNPNNDWIQLGLDAGINYIQLHGEESVERCKYIKKFKCKLSLFTLNKRHLWL